MAVKDRPHLKFDLQYFIITPIYTFTTSYTPTLTPFNIFHLHV